MGVYIELPKEWAKWSFDVRDIHDNILVEKVTDLDLVRCGECKHKPIKHDPEGDDFGFNLVSPNGYDNLCPCLNTDDGFYSYMPDDNFFCAYGERRSE